MRKFTLITAVIIMTAFVWTSCIDNEVAPEVAAIRAAQVDLLKARTAYVQAEIAYQEALTAGVVINNSIRSEDLKQKIAETESALAWYKEQVKRAELSLQIAIDDLARYIATNKLNDAATYLNNYINESNLLSTLFVTKANKETELAKAEMLLNATAGPNQNVAFDLLKEEFERDLATAQAELAAEQSALTALQAVAADPATIQTALNTANASLADLKNKRKQLDVDLANATKAETEANKKRDDAAAVIASYNTVVANLATNATNITNQNATIATNTTAVTTATANVSTANAALTAANTNLTNAKTAQAAKQTLFNAAKADLEAKNNAVIVAAANVDIAQANFDADPTPANQTALDNANTALTNAQNAQATSQTAYNTAETNLNNANANVTQYQNAYNTAKATYDAAVTALNNAQATLTASQLALSNLNVTKADLEAEKAALETANTDAVANLEAYKIAAALATNAKTPINTAITNNTAQQNALNSLITSLSGSITGLNADIETKKNLVETKKRAVGAAQKALDDNAISKEEAMTKIEDLKTDLKSIDEQISAKTKLVAKWKALLDAALG